MSTRTNLENCLTKLLLTGKHRPCRVKYPCQKRRNKHPHARNPGVTGCYYVLLVLQCATGSRDVTVCYVCYMCYSVLQMLQCALLPNCIQAAAGHEIRSCPNSCHVSWFLPITAQNHLHFQVVNRKRNQANRYGQWRAEWSQGTTASRHSTLGAGKKKIKFLKNRRNTHFLQKIWYSVSNEKAAQLTLQY